MFLHQGWNGEDKLWKRPIGDSSIKLKCSSFLQEKDDAQLWRLFPDGQMQSRKEVSRGEESITPTEKRQSVGDEEEQEEEETRGMK